MRHGWEEEQQGEEDESGANRDEHCGTGNSHGKASRDVLEKSVAIKDKHMKEECWKD